MKDYSQVLETAKVQYKLYKANHELFAQWIKSRKHKFTLTANQTAILQMIPNGKSLWLDSFGYALGSKNIISIEEKKYKKVFGSFFPNMYFKEDIFSEETCKILNKLITPASVVIYFSPLFKYLLEDELYKQLTVLKTSFPDSKIIVGLDSIFLDFNKIKWSVDSVINRISFATNSNILKLDETRIVIQC